MGNAPLRSSKRMASTGADGRALDAKTGNPLSPTPEEVREHGLEAATLAFGCYWGVQRDLCKPKGVWSSAVGYDGGHVENPSYQEVCSGRTGHAEAVRLYFDPKVTAYGELLKIFWESHNPTQVGGNGNDRGSQYRGAIFYHSDEQRRLAESSRDAYQARLTEKGFGRIATEIVPAGTFYVERDPKHQHYFFLGTGSYCSLRGTGVACPLPTKVKADL